jgi:lycopene cyclase domain-containing protein
MAKNMLLPAAILFLWKAPFLTRFYFSYIILLFPFLIINGILTGLFITGEIVWYNNEEILGIRILTIPIEDFFYGMLLLLMNTAAMEYLLASHKSR